MRTELISDAVSGVIKKLLAGRKWSVSALAKEVGTNRVTLSRWAKGGPPGDTLQAIAQLFKLADASIDEAFGIDPTTNEAEIRQLSQAQLVELEPQYHRTIERLKLKTHKLRKSKEIVDDCLLHLAISRSLDEDISLRRRPLRMLKENQLTISELVVLRELADRLLIERQKGEANLKRFFEQSPEDETSPRENEHSARLDSKRKIDDESE